MSKHIVADKLLERETTTETVEAIVEEVKQEEPDLKLGTVTCNNKLNVRKQPEVNPNNIICEIAPGSEVMIDETESTEDFYKVCTEAGVEGFCMKKFIAVK